MINIKNNEAIIYNYLLQSIINFIDKRVFWEKYYETLETEEKKVDLNKIVITDFLEDEKKKYGFKDDSGDDYEKALRKLKYIEKKIPKNFNFKERLKLILCAVCHTSINIENTADIDLNIDEVIKNFKNFNKTIDKIILSDNSSVKNNNNSEYVNVDVDVDVNDKIKKLKAIHQQNLEIIENYNEKVKTYKVRTKRMMDYREEQEKNKLSLEPRRSKRTPRPIKRFQGGSSMENS